MAYNGECLCETCSTDIVLNVQAMRDPPGFLTRQIRDRSLVHVGAVEFFPPEEAGALVAGGVVTALLDVLCGQPPTTEPTRLTYCAARGAGAVIRKMPAEGEQWHEARVDYARRLAAVLRGCERARLPVAQQTFAGVLCCCLDALFSGERFVELKMIGSNRTLRLDAAGRRVREEVCDRDDFPKRFVLRNLFQVIGKPRNYCQMEKELRGDVSCLHNNALSAICKMLLDQGEAARIASRRIVLREVPATLATLMGLVRDPSVPDDVLCHALYTLAEVLKEDVNGETNSSAELLRLAPDALTVFVRTLFRVDETGLPALLDVMFLFCTYSLSVQDHAGDRERRSPFAEVAIFLFEPESRTSMYHGAACLILRALVASLGTKFVKRHLADCSKEIYGQCGGIETPRQLDRDDFDSQRSFRAAREVLEWNHVAAQMETERSTRQMGEIHPRLFAKWRIHICEHCSLSDEETGKRHGFCKACRRSHFCTKQHQKAAWKLGHHKALCEAYSRLGNWQAQIGLDTGTSGLSNLAVERSADVNEVVQDLTDRAARAGVPSACIIIVVEKPAPIHTAVGSDAESVEDASATESQPLHVSWMSPLEWSGFFASRMLSFEMDPATYPSLQHRQAALAVQMRWMEDMRQSWWSLGEDEKTSNSSGSQADEADCESLSGESSECASYSTREEMDCDDPIGRRAALLGRNDASSPFFRGGRRYYRVAWWEWTSRGYRNIRFSHCRLSMEIAAPKLSARFVRTST